MYFPSHPIATLCSDFLTPATYRVCIRVGEKKKKKENSATSLTESNQTEIDGVVKHFSKIPSV